MVGDRGEPREAVWMRRAEIRQPLVVDADHLDRGLRIIHPTGGAEDPVENLTLYAVAVLVLQAQLWIAQPANPTLPVLVQTGRRHPVGAVNSAGNVLAPCRAHAARAPEHRPLLRDPRGPLRPVTHEWHPLLPFRGSTGDEEVGREPAEVDVAIRRDELVSHEAPPRK